MLVLRPGCAVECLDGGCRIAADDVFVVAMVLGKGFLEDRAIDRFIFACRSVQCMVVVARLLKWEIVVDNDSVRDAEGVELHGVDAVCAHLFVHENFLHAASFFGKGRSSRNEPAVADCSLTHVLRRHTVFAEKTVSLLTRENIFCSLP